MPGAGNSRAEAQLSTTIASGDRIKYQQLQSAYPLQGQYCEREITYANLISGEGSNFVTLTGAQTVAGVKTFSNQVTTPVGVGVTVTAGSNAKQGTATLASGTVTVSNTAVTANSKIYLTRTSINGSTALGELIIGTITAATSFVINAVIVATPGSLQTGDASIVEYLIVEAV